MGILTNITFWIIIVLILVIFAFIGYLAEGTRLTKKKEKKVKDDGLTTSNQKNKDNTWSSDAPKKDEKMETVYKVDSVDDWNTMPDTLKGKKEDNGDNLLPEVKTEKLTLDEKTSKEDKAESLESDEMFPDIKSDDLEPKEEVLSDSNDDSVWK